MWKQHLTERSLENCLNDIIICVGSLRMALYIEFYYEQLVVRENCIHFKFESEQFKFIFTIALSGEVNQSNRFHGPLGLSWPTRVVMTYKGCSSPLGF